MRHALDAFASQIGSLSASSFNFESVLCESEIKIFLTCCAGQARFWPNVLNQKPKSKQTALNFVLWETYVFLSNQMCIVAFEFSTTAGWKRTSANRMSKLSCCFFSFLVRRKFSSFLSWLKNVSSCNFRQDSNKRQVQSCVHWPPETRTGKRILLQPIHHHPPQSRTGWKPRTFWTPSKNLVPKSKSEGKEAEQEERGAGRENTDAEFSPELGRRLGNRTVTAEHTSDARGTPRHNRARSVLISNQICVDTSLTKQRCKNLQLDVFCVIYVYW